MLITLLEHYRTTVQRRMRSVSDALFMRKLMQTAESTVSVCDNEMGFIEVSMPC